MVTPGQGDADTAAFDDQPAPDAGIPVNDPSLPIKRESQERQNGERNGSSDKTEQPESSA
jgi:hypothetical protein